MNTSSPSSARQPSPLFRLLGLSGLARLPRRLADARVALGLFALLLITAVWGLTLFQLAHTREQQLLQAERDARSLARLFKEHASRTIEAADQTLIHLRYRYTVAGRQLDVARELEKGLNSDDIYALFTIVDEHADVILSSKPFQAVNLRDREHIQVQMQAHDDRLFISKPVLGRVSQKWTIQMTRRIAADNGALLGVVVVSMDPKYFIRLYQDIDVGQFGVISLTGEDGVVRARRSGNDETIGQSQAQSPLFQAMRERGAGLLQAVSSIDGRERIYAFAHLDHYPLYASVGIDLEERLAGYRATRDQMLELAGITTLILLLATGGLILLIGRLIKSRAQAIAANQAKSRFLSNMSHELRTPLNGILGYAELLLESGAPEEAEREYANAIHASGTRLLELVNEVLLLSALESGTGTLHCQREILTELLERALERHHPTAAAKGLALSWRVAAEVPAIVWCDRTRLLPVLDRLLHNAVRYTDCGAVTLECLPAVSGLLLQVSDTGRGIALAHQQHIFDKFTQEDDSPARTAGGAGLGLATAAALVRLMGGRLQVESAPGHGARFSFILPLQADNSQAAPAPETAAALPARL